MCSESLNIIAKTAFKDVIGKNNKPSLLPNTTIYHVKQAGVFIDPNIQRFGSLTYVTLDCHRGFHDHLSALFKPYDS
jgi:hypothetical protein